MSRSKWISRKAALLFFIIQISTLKAQGFDIETCLEMAKGSVAKLKMLQEAARNSFIAIHQGIDDEVELEKLRTKNHGITSVQFLGEGGESFVHRITYTTGDSENQKTFKYDFDPALVEAGITPDKTARDKELSIMGNLLSFAKELPEGAIKVAKVNAHPSDEQKIVVQDVKGRNLYKFLEDRTIPADFRNEIAKLYKIRCLHFMQELKKRFGEENVFIMPFPLAHRPRYTDELQHGDFPFSAFVLVQRPGDQSLSFYFNVNNFILTPEIDMVLIDSE